MIKGNNWKSTHRHHGNGLLPYRGLKRVAHLIKGEGLEGIQDVRGEIRVVKAEMIARDAQPHSSFQVVKDEYSGNSKRTYFENVRDVVM